MNPESGTSPPAASQAKFPGIVLSSLQDQVVNALREMLLSGEIPPGTMVPEGALARQFGVSRTPIREAFKQLQVEGLVEVRSRVGTFAARPSLQDSVEIAPLREVVEGLAARLCANRLDPETLAKLEANVNRSEQDVASDRTANYAQKVHDFHDLVIAGAGNPKLAEVHRQLINKLSYHRRVMFTLQQPGRPQDSVKEHHLIFDHIRAGNGEAAESAMRDHIQKSHQQLIDAIRSLPGESDGGSDLAR